MSSPNKYTLSLTQEAEGDFIDILVYTAQEWGAEKLQEYDASLSHALDVVKDNPFLGYRHSLLPEDHRCFNVRKHVLVYQIKKRGQVACFIIYLITLINRAANSFLIFPHDFGRESDLGDKSSFISQPSHLGNSNDAKK